MPLFSVGVSVFRSVYRHDSWRGFVSRIWGSSSSGSSAHFGVFISVRQGDVKPVHYAVGRLLYYRETPEALGGPVGVEIVPLIGIFLDIALKDLCQFTHPPPDPLLSFFPGRAVEVNRLLDDPQVFASLEYDEDG